MYYAICCNCFKVMMRSSMSTVLRFPLHLVDDLGRKSTFVQSSCRTMIHIGLLGTLPFLTPLSAYNTYEHASWVQRLAKGQCFKARNHVIWLDKHIFCLALDASEIACFFVKLDTSSSIIKRSWRDGDWC